MTLCVAAPDRRTEAAFAQVQGRLQFKVNLDMLKRGNYKVSSQLLKLAVNVR